MYNYQQNDRLVRLQRYNGKFTREEYSEFTVTPTADGTRKARTHFLGKYAAHGKVVEYDKPGYQYKGIDIDGPLAQSLADSMSNNDKSKDGIAHDMFPLIAKQQKQYSFHLAGTEEYRGAPVFRITFESQGGDEEDGPWAGEALIDKQDYQPVLVTTHLAAKIPILVRTMLGTNLEHLGFKVTYKKFDKGLWFPVTYGGEFRVRALFLYARRVGLSVQNSDFQRTDVTTRIDFLP